MRVIWISKIREINNKIDNFLKLSDEALKTLFRSESTEEWVASAITLGRRACEKVELAQFILEKLDQEENIHRKRHAFTAFGILMGGMNKLVTDKKGTDIEQNKTLKFLRSTTFKCKDLKGLDSFSLSESIKYSILDSYLKKTDTGKNLTIKDILKWIRPESRLKKAADQIKSDIAAKTKIKVNQELQNKDTTPLEKAIKELENLANKLQQKTYDRIKFKDIQRYINPSTKKFQLEDWCFRSFLYSIPELDWPIDEILFQGAFEKQKGITNLTYVLYATRSKISKKTKNDLFKFLLGKARHHSRSDFNFFEDVLDLYYIYKIERQDSFLKFTDKNFKHAQALLNEACAEDRNDSEENIYKLSRFLLSKLAPRPEFIQEFPNDTEKTTQFWLLLLAVLSIKESITNDNKTCSCQHIGLKIYFHMSLLEEKIEELIYSNEDIVCNLLRILKNLYYDSLKDEKNEKKLELLILRQQVFISKFIELWNWRGSIEKDIATITVRIFDIILNKKGLKDFLFQLFLLEKYIPSKKILNEIAKYALDERISSFFTLWNTSFIQEKERISNREYINKTTENIVSFIDNNFSSKDTKYCNWFLCIKSEGKIIEDNKEFTDLLNHFFQVKHKIDILSKPDMFKNLVSFFRSYDVCTGEDFRSFLNLIESESQYLADKSIEEYESIIADIKRNTLDEKIGNLQGFQKIIESMPDLIKSYNKLKLWFIKELPVNHSSIIINSWLDKKITAKEEEYDSARDFLFAIENNDEKKIIQKLGLYDEENFTTLESVKVPAFGNIVQIIERWMYHRFMLSELLKFKVRNSSLSPFIANMMRGFFYKFRYVIGIIFLPYIFWMLSTAEVFKKLDTAAAATLKIYVVIIFILALLAPILTLIMLISKKIKSRRAAPAQKKESISGIQIYHLFYPKIAALLFLPTLAQLSDEIWSSGLGLGPFGLLTALIYLVLTFWIIRAVIMGDISNVLESDKQKRTFHVLSLSLLFSFAIQIFFMVIDGKTMALRTAYDVTVVKKIMGIPRHIILNFSDIPVFNYFLEEIYLFPIMLLSFTAAVLFVGIALQIFISRDKLNE